MIARIWHGKVPAEKTNAYHDYLNATGLKDYARVNGNRGVFLLKKEDHNITHFYTLTFWDGWEAIRDFAGNDYEKAKYYPEDKDFLMEFETQVNHYEVLEKPASFGEASNL